ncbi:MAG: hypothetical protein GX146_10510 [Myxococcales bacterium]|jgi:2-oxoglutarate ferredoxin oxidoreductase subunit beta|nr:hypothetical protein [Myxococcales bacterium]
MTRDLSHWLRHPDAPTAFCPGCGHGILLGTLLRAIDTLAIAAQDLLFVSGIGCAGWIPSPHILADTLHTLHGRAIPFATGAKLANPRLTTIVISGDGDLLSIGAGHLVHAARRNIDLTVIVANNGIYGMTGGQTAATTPLGVSTATHRAGNPDAPVDACQLALAAGARYAARFPVTDPPRLQAAIARAIATPGFALVDALSPCPTQYGKFQPEDSIAACYRRFEADVQQRSDAATGAAMPFGEFVP